MQSLIYDIPYGTILLSMAAGIISSILPAKAAYRLNTAMITLSLILNGILLGAMAANPTTITYLMGHFSAPWGNELRFGPFEALMATVFSLVMLLACLGERKTVADKVEVGRQNLFYLMMNLLLSSTLALVYTNDLFTAYVFVEINTLCACGFVAAKNSRKAIAATIKYLIMSLLGSGLFLISIILMYVMTGHLLMPNVQSSIAAMMASGAYTMPLTITVGLMAVSIAIKSALFPFHNWVPTAYDRAIQLSNALSSGLVLKSYIILLIKIFYRVLGLDIICQLEVVDILFLFGLLSMIAASVDAMRENNVKKMLAYSSIAQIGYIYVGIGLGTTAGFVAAAYTIIAHSLTKSMLFVACEGLMLEAKNSKHADNLLGSAHRNPIAALAFTVGAFSMIGFPLLSGFYSKYLLAVAAVSHSTKSWYVLFALVVSTVLNAIYFLRIVQTIYTKNPEHTEGRIHISNRYKCVMVAFMVVNLAFGFGFDPISQLIQLGLGYL